MAVDVCDKTNRPEVSDAKLVANDDICSENKSNPNTTVGKKAHGRRSFSKGDVILLNATFQREISELKITTSGVVTILPTIQSQLSQTCTTQQICDRVNCIIRANNKLRK